MIINRFFQNTRKPKGILGKMMLKGMNRRHAKVSAWGFSNLAIPNDSHILDVGCGGGANIKIMLKNVPGSIVDGLDHSEESVAFSKKVNAAHIGERCHIHQGDVSHLPYSTASLDHVTAFETIYFWPDLDAAFVEIKRVLKQNGTFFICCETDDTEDTKWTDLIDGMIIHKGEDIKERLLRAGFEQVDMKRNEKGWICLKATNAA